MFKITGKKGFHVEFANGFTVSVQFGPGNYCDNYNMQIGEEETLAGSKGSANAECAVWGNDGKMIDMFDGGTVSNRSTPAQVLALLVWASAQQGVQRTAYGNGWFAFFGVKIMQLGLWLAQIGSR